VRLPTGASRARRVQREAGGAQRPEHVVRDAAREELELFGAPLGQLGVAAHDAHDHDGRRDRQQHAGDVQRHGEADGLPAEPLDARRQDRAALGVALDQAHEQLVEPLDRGAQLLRQHLERRGQVTARHEAVEPLDVALDLGHQAGRFTAEGAFFVNAREPQVVPPGALDRGARVPQLGGGRRALAVRRPIDGVAGQQDVPAKLAAQGGQAGHGRRRALSDLAGGALDADVGVLRDRGRQDEGHGHPREGRVDGPCGPRRLALACPHSRHLAGPSGLGRTFRPSRGSTRRLTGPRGRNINPRFQALFAHRSQKEPFPHVSQDGPHRPQDRNDPGFPR
jgi:hypothetical protein